MKLRVLYLLKISLQVSCELLKIIMIKIPLLFENQHKSLIKQNLVNIYV